MKTLMILVAALASCACGEGVGAGALGALGAITTSSALSPVGPEARPEAGPGCPVLLWLGAKGYTQPHPGQWLTATYPGGVCGPTEWDTAWEITPRPALFDICRDSAALADKRCGDKVGKFFWIGSVGTYTVTATAPAGGSASMVVSVRDGAALRAAPAAPCSFTLINAVKGFGALAAGVVAEGEGEGGGKGCPAPLVTWSLLTAPDGVVYRVYETREDLLTDRPTAGPGRYLKVLSFIAANGVCVAATDGLTSRRVGLVGTPQSFCDGL